MNKNILIGIVAGILLLGGIGFGAYKFLSIEDVEFNQKELNSVEEKVSSVIQAYHQHGWEGISSMMYEPFINEYSAGELNKILEFLVGPNKTTDSYSFVMEEFNPPAPSDKTAKTEVSGVITKNRFPISLGKFQLINQDEEWLISGFFGEPAQGVSPIQAEKEAQLQTKIQEFFRIAAKNSDDAYESTFKKFQEETNLIDFERIISVLTLPLTSELKCEYLFESDSSRSEGIDGIYVLKKCNTNDEYNLELTLLQQGEDLKIGGLFIK